MIELYMSIKKKNIEDIKFPVCDIFASKKHLNEVKQAVLCERNYNGSELTWDGFTYEK